MENTLQYPDCPSCVAKNELDPHCSTCGGKGWIYCTMAELITYHKQKGIRVPNIQYPDDGVAHDAPQPGPVYPKYYSRDLEELTQNVAEWSNQTFGPHNISKHTGRELGELPTFCVLVSEVGELANAIACRHQGRKGFDDPAKFDAEMKDAMADIMITLCSVSFYFGIDLQEIALKAWNEIVSKRTIKNWEEHKHEVPSGGAN